MPRSRDRRRRKCTVVVAGRLLVLAGADDVGRRAAGDLRRTPDLVLSSAARRQSVPAAQRAGSGAVRHDPVLRAKRLACSQVAPSSPLLRTYTPASTVSMQ